MNKLRFHLAAGKNFMHWQVTTSNGIQYFDPDTTQFRLTGCELKNNLRQATKIYNGGDKSVCAYVQFQIIEIVHGVEVGEQVRYNPRVLPYWTLNWSTHCIDNMILPELYTLGNSICLPK